MATVSSRELRNRARDLLVRVESGEEIAITVDGRPVARLVPVPHRPGWMKRERFVGLLLQAQADPSLRSELPDLLPDTTDDFPS